MPDRCRTSVCRALFEIRFIDGLVRKCQFFLKCSTTIWNSLPVNLLLFTLFICCPTNASDYSGNVGRWKAAYSLNWNANGEVEGTYHYPGKRKTVYTLKGNVASEGELYLEEYTGKKLSARCYLTETQTDTMIIWKGKMHNTDGRKFDMTISRAKTAEERSPEKMRETEKAKLQELEKKKFSGLGDYAIYAHNLEIFERCRIYRAVVDSVEREEGDGNITRSQPAPAFTLKDDRATLTWNDELGPAPFSKNVDALVSSNSDGEVKTAMVWIVPAKWRKRHNGEVEFLLWGTSDTGEKVVGKSSFTGQPLKVAKEPFVLRPIRFDEFFAETYFIAVQGVGAVIGVFEAGPGMVELESVSLDAEDNSEIPWIDLPAGGEFPKPAASQYISNGNQ